MSTSCINEIANGKVYSFKTTGNCHGKSMMTNVIVIHENKVKKRWHFSQGL